MADSSIKGLYLGPEGTPYEGGELLHNVLLFGRTCKALGMDVTPNSMIETARALEYIQIGRRREFYFTLRAMMVNRQRDLPVFDEAFKLFWKRHDDGWTTLDLRTIGQERKKQKIQYAPLPDSEDGDDSMGDAPQDDPIIAMMPTYSQIEALRHKAFSEMTEEELMAVRRSLARLPKSLGLRRTRRFKRGRGRQIDMRGVIRGQMRNFGEVLDLPTRARRLKPRPIVLICDISGSMERYTRILLHFMHTLDNHMSRVESFLYSTHLSRVTHQIRHKSVDRALHDVGLKVHDWGGGTRTGDALHEFNYRWSRRVLGRGAIVMIITDGWDRGDPEMLASEMARLQRSCHRLIWLNPLLGAPQYEPLTRGAQAMLPLIDDFLPVRNLANLEMLIGALQPLKWQGRAQV